MERLGAVILAAGLSSRMGEFKPLLPIGGVSMIRVRGPDAGRRRRDRGGDRLPAAKALEAHLVGCGVRFVQPGLPACQMLDSLRLGLGTLPAGCNRFLLSPADVPLVRPQDYQALLALDSPFVPLIPGRAGSTRWYFAPAFFPLSAATAAPETWAAWWNLRRARPSWRSVALGSAWTATHPGQV